MKAHERLLKYVSYRTPSDENSETSPSSQCQFSLAHALVEELKELGVEDAACDEYCYMFFSWGSWYVPVHVTIFITCRIFNT